MPIPPLSEQGYRNYDSRLAQAYANPIINGDMRICQRGTAVVSIADSTYTVDRWIYGKTSAVVQDFSQTTDVPSVAKNVPGTNNALALTVTTADSTIAVGDLAYIGQHIEGYNWLPFAEKQLTVGFWVKDAVTGVHCVALVNSGLDRSCVVEYTVNTANTWEYKTVTFPASPSMSTGTWSTSTGIGVRLLWPLICGTTYQTTANAWQTGRYYATSSIQNSVGTNSNVFKLWGVTMGLGPTVAPYWPRSYGDELALCQRYYEVFGGTTNGFPRILTNNSGIGQYIGMLIPFKIMKRATPTVTRNGTWTVNSANQPSVLGATIYGFTLYSTSTSTGSVDIAPDSSDDTITVEAEL